MLNQLSNIVQTIQSYSLKDGISNTLVAGVDLIKFSTEDNKAKRHWKSSYAIIIQGSKNIVLGNKTLCVNEGDCLVNTLDLPIVSQINEASPTKPFIALRLDIDVVILREIAFQLGLEQSHVQVSDLCSTFLHHASHNMINTATRLVGVLKNPVEAPIIGPLLVKELIYYLLISPDGRRIYQFFRADNKHQKISAAARYIRENLTNPINIKALAKKAGMSRSAFFAHFKDATSMTPLNYQKRFRLLEARRLLLEESNTAELAGWNVGYKSASHFSRDYVKMFGKPPVKDTEK